MAHRAFGGALRRKFAARQRKTGSTEAQMVLVVSVYTGYTERTVRRHLYGEALPRDCKAAERYALFFGDGDGHLMAAFRRARAARDAENAVTAHLQRIGGMIVSGIVLACPALMGDVNCPMARTPVAPRKVVTAMRKGDPRRRRTAPRARR